MTLTINPEHVYIAIILLLMVIQIYQWTLVKKLIKECDLLWTQIGTLAAGLSNQIINMQQDISKKEDKKAG